MLRKLITYTALAIISCGSPKKNPVDPRPNTTIDEVVTEARSHAVSYDGLPVFFPPANDQGNAGLFAGLLCFSGEDDMCDQIPRLLDNNDRIIRNTWDESNSDIDGASRDELLGHLLYIAKTHDKNHARRLINGISSLDGKLCPKASDTRCIVTPGMWGLMKQVWQHIGLEPSSNMIVGNMGDETALILQAKEAKPNFNSHLIGVNIMLRMHMNTFTPKLDEAISYLVAKSPNNPFYRLLKRERKLAETKFLEQAQQAEWTVQRHWTWEQDYAVANFKEANAWAIIFLGNVLTKGF